MTLRVLDSEVKVVKLYNASGEFVSEFHTSQINLSDQATGSYTIVITTATGKNYTEKIQVIN